MAIRRVEELTDVPDPAWEAIRYLADQNPSTTVVDSNPKQNHEVLWRLQVTARSFLGAMALNSGGVLADHGWFRLLGGGSPHLADLAAANGLGEPKDDAVQPPCLLVGYDALGGRFAIDGGALGVGAGEVCFFGPDSLAWEGLGGGHADFVSAAISGQLADTFSALRWSGWQEEVGRLLPDQGLAAYPPPFSREGQEIGAASRRTVPIQELFDFYDEAARQLEP